MIFQLKIFKYEFIENLPIIYIDESGFAVDAIRNGGYSSKGQRCHAGKDRHARGRVNAIGAITNFKLFNICLFDGYVNADVFYARVSQELVPCITGKSIIVLDNATFHKRSDALEAIKKVGHIIAFLPPYSPDLNPIEKKWGQAKGIRRKFNYTTDELFLYTKL